MIGELAEPHSYSGRSYAPTSSRPRFFFHKNFPPTVKANNPSDPKNATTYFPSVAGVEFA